jgi:hypothetical protein
LYVDDLIYIGDDENMMVEFKESMMKEFDMKDLGKMKYFLGIEVVQFDGGIFISQAKYVMEVLRRLEWSITIPLKIQWFQDSKSPKMKMVLRWMVHSSSS